MHLLFKAPAASHSDDVNRSESDDDDVIYIPFEVKRPRMARPEECQLDDEVRQTQPEASDDTSRAGASGSDKDSKPRAADWRFGPAQLWYDMLGVSETGENFDYGFHMKYEASKADTTQPCDDVTPDDTSARDTDVITGSAEHTSKVEFPPEAFNMVTQVHWEDDVIYNGEESKQAVMTNMKRAGAVAGWIPSSACRSLSQYLQQSTLHFQSVEFKLTKFFL